MSILSSQFKMVVAQAEICPGGCGRDRFDHDIMGYPCTDYLAYLRENNPAKYQQVITTQAKRALQRAMEDA